MVLPYNPYIPSVIQSAFVPDRLIAGDKKLVTRNVTVAAGQVLFRGAVMGRVTQGALTAAAKAGGNTGNGTIGGLALASDPLPGAYTLLFTSPTAFTVTDPQGNARAPGQVGQPYGGQAIDFLVSAGATPFVAGDAFTLSSTAPSGEYLLSAAAATDGSQNPIGILVDAIDTSATGFNAPTRSAIYLEGEFNVNSLQFGAGQDAGLVLDALALRGCHLKNPVSGAPDTYA